MAVQMIVGPKPNRAIALRGEERADEGADAAGRDHDAQQERAEVQVLDQVDRVEDGVERAGEVGKDRAEGQGHEDRMVPDELEALDDLMAHRHRCSSRRAGWLRTPDQEQRDRRYDKGNGIDKDRQGRPDHLDESAREAGTADLGKRGARGQLAVALDHPIDADERRNIGRIGRIEEGAEAALEEDDQVQLLDPQDARNVGHGDREQHDRPDRIGPDQQRPSQQAVDPGTGDEPDEQDGEAARDHEQRHLAVDPHRGRGGRRAGPPSGSRRTRARRPSGRPTAS